MRKLITIGLLIMSMYAIALTQTKLVDKTVMISNDAVGYTNFTASAYTLRGKTASGVYTKAGMIATDPRVIPTGSTVHILGMGTFVATDTGGKIKNKRIDIWMGSRYNAIKFGMKNVKLKIITYGTRKSKRG